MKMHPEPKITNFRLSEDKLRDMATDAIDIRRKIDEKAMLYNQVDSIPLHDE
jgi:hypothetical protein